MRNLTALEIHVHADFGYGRHNPRIRWKKHEDTGSVSEISKEIHMRDDRQLSASPPSGGLTSTVLPSSRFIGPRNNPEKNRRCMTIEEQYVKRKFVHREREEVGEREGAKGREERGLGIICRWNLSGIPEDAPLGATPVERIVPDLRERRNRT